MTEILSRMDRRAIKMQFQVAEVNEEEYSPVGEQKKEVKIPILKRLINSQKTRLELCK